MTVSVTCFCYYLWFLYGWLYCDYGNALFADKPIFSVDIHPTGKRFATGGQGGDSGRVVVWNLNSVLYESVEVDPNIPKMLCQMDNHLGKMLVNDLTWLWTGFSYYRHVERNLELNCYYLSIYVIMAQVNLLSWFIVVGL